MKSLIKYMAFLSLLALILFSCSENEVAPDPTKDLIKVAEGTITDAQAEVEVWVDQELVAGYNRLYIRLRQSDNDKVISLSDIELMPMMYMTGGMNHTCPFENPESEATNGLFAASVFFVMPSSDMGFWKLTVAVYNPVNENSGEVELDITVGNPDPAKMCSFTATTGEKYFISYFFPEKPKVGINDWVVTAYQRQSGMSWPAAEDFTFVLTPEMPSMEHGSPNNVNPAHTSGAYYLGKVNFTMTGLWRLHLSIQRDDEELYETYFDLTLD